MSEIDSLLCHVLIKLQEKTKFLCSLRTDILYMYISLFIVSFDT